ncbi:unnamed protein product [Gordionus sp. m RMFG-2023]|uniref:Kv channel-interacting protein 2-like isoform X2 n=1 Tax=Gordionus sp. m RMFG-2023 TaxID=3053472 RepID=UPI0030E4F0C9
MKRSLVPSSGKFSPKRTRKGEETCSPEYVQAIPPNLNSICSKTKFERKEIKLLYQIFKQHCPQGFLTLNIFKSIFEILFPLGNSSRYASYFYRCLDVNKDGMVGFETFISTLSKMNYGTFEERATIIFKIYDLKDEGFLTKESLFNIISSVYDLANLTNDPYYTYSNAQQHSERFFRKLKMDQNGKVAMKEFTGMLIREECLEKSHTNFPIVSANI